MINFCKIILLLTKNMEQIAMVCVKQMQNEWILILPILSNSSSVLDVLQKSGQNNNPGEIRKSVLHFIIEHNIPIAKYVSCRATIPCNNPLPKKYASARTKTTAVIKLMAHF